LNQAYWGNILIGLGVACFPLLAYLYSKEKKEKDNEKEESTEVRSIPILGLILLSYFAIFKLVEALVLWEYISEFAFFVIAVFTLFLFGFYFFKNTSSSYRIKETVLFMLLLFLPLLGSALKSF